MYGLTHTLYHPWGSLGVMNIIILFPTVANCSSRHKAWVKVAVRLMIAAGHLNFPFRCLCKSLSTAEPPAYLYVCIVGLSWGRGLCVDIYGDQTGSLICGPHHFHFPCVYLQTSHHHKTYRNTTKTNTITVKIKTPIFQ